jgi:hypothetical protein
LNPIIKRAFALIAALASFGFLGHATDVRAAQIQAEYAVIDALPLLTGGQTSVTFYFGADQQTAVVNFLAIPIGATGVVTNWGQGSIVFRGVDYVIDFDINKIEYNTGRANISLVGTDAIFSGNGDFRQTTSYDTPTSRFGISLQSVVTVPIPTSILLVLVGGLAFSSARRLRR